MNTRLSHSLLTILCLIAVCLLTLGAAGTPSLALADTQGAWSDVDQDGLDDGWEATLAERFAPLVYLHHHEEHFPSYINWYLQRTWIGYGPSLYDKTHQVDPVGNVSTLISQSHPTGDSDVPTYSGAANQKAAGWADIATTDYFLEVNGESTYFGDKSPGVFGRWPVYVHVLRSPEKLEHPKDSGSYKPSHPGMIDIQYWFFYPFNGALGWSCTDDCAAGLDICCPCLAGGSHEGDWEYVIVRVQADGETVHSVYYSRHSGEGRWEIPGGYAVRTDNPELQGPIVYAAHHSHANYTHEGKHTEGPATPDFTDDGFTWDTSLNINNIGELWHPMPGMEWIQYTGRWGELHFDVSTDPHGPYGPATKSPWAVYCRGDVDRSGYGRRYHVGIYRELLWITW